MKKEKVSLSTIISKGTLFLIVIISILIMFDNDPSNDFKSWTLILGYWIFQYSFDLIKDIKANKKKAALVDLLFLICMLGVLIWGNVSFITRIF